MKISQTGQFRRDLKRLVKRGKDPAKLKAAIALLFAGKPLPPKYPDHPLIGNWSDDATATSNRTGF